MRKFSLALCTAALAVAVFTACDSGKPSKPAAESAAPAAAKPAPKETVQDTGRQAFQYLYATARMWAPDGRPYRLQSDLIKGTTGQDGKAAVWRSGFASGARRSLKAIVWSGSHSDDAPAFGVSSGVEDTYSPGNSSTQVFDLVYLKIDSDKAYEVAQEHGGQKLLKKDPKQPVIYLLDWDPRESRLLWHVIYGTGPEDAKLRIAVNATTGVYVRTEK
jgi:hypothetical protein